MSNRLTTASEEEDDEWLFDSIVLYLSSPIWTIPIQHFMEQNCIVFSPADGWSGGALLEDDDKEIDMSKVPFEHLQIHSKYKELVDNLINSFLQDLSVSNGRFLRACRNSSQFTQHPIYLELFEQIWSAENFKMFKSQMVKKNIELELQALILLQAQLGLMKTLNGDVDKEDEIMTIVIRKSKDEYDALINNKQRTPSNESTRTDMPIKKPQDLEIAKKLVKSEKITENLKSELKQQDSLSRQIAKDAVLNGTKSDESDLKIERPVSARKKEIDNLNAKFDNINQSNKRAVSNLRLREEEDDDNDDIQASASAYNYESSSNQIVNSLALNYLQHTGVNSEAELARRAEFMQKQRELLNQKKLVERKKQLDQFMRESEQNEGIKRPMSSRAARSVLAGADPTQIQPANTSNDEERKKIEARKALAETLRKEVINNSKK